MWRLTISVAELQSRQIISTMRFLWPARIHNSVATSLVWRSWFLDSKSQLNTLTNLITFLQLSLLECRCWMACSKDKIGSVQSSYLLALYLLVGWPGKIGLGVCQMSISVLCNMCDLNVGNVFFSCGWFRVQITDTKAVLWRISFFFFELTLALLKSVRNRSHAFSFLWRTSSRYCPLLIFFFP